MESNFYQVNHAELTPSSVQPLPQRGDGKKIEPIEFNLTEHTDNANERLNIWEDMCIRADEFRLWLATRCCACLASVPSFALVIIAVFLIMLLIATIPLAFALTYMSPQARTAEDPSSNGNGTNILFPDRSHSWFPNESELVKYADWDDHIPLKTALLMPKNITTCTIYGFACTGKPHIVISKNRRCDGYPDCGDGSDELDCHKCQTSISCPASNQMHSGRKLCLVGAHLCDNQVHCPSGEDETTYCQAECKEGQHKCRDINMCIPEETICDGEVHCPYGDDEENCAKDKCQNGAKYCDEKLCIPKRKLCDGSTDCRDGSDEQDCDCASCSGKNSVLCNGPEKLCIEKNRVCDGNKDCPRGEDEEGCPGVCPILGGSDFIQNKIANNELIRCADGELYEWREACNGLNQHCVRSCTKCNPEMAFQCGTERIHRMGNLTVIGGDEMNATTTDGKTNLEAKMKIHNTLKECIHRSLVCDGKPDCSDGSDELCSCGPNTTQCQSHFSGKQLTPIKHCFLDSQKCDGFTDCMGGEDERNCSNCQNGAFHCPSEKRCIPSSARCDGKVDCLDASDEENCTCEECASHATKMYMCSGSARCFLLEKVCTPYSQCPNATKMDKLFCAVRGKEYF